MESNPSHVITWLLLRKVLSGIQVCRLIRWASRRADNWSARLRLRLWPTWFRVRPAKIEARDGDNAQLVETRRKRGRRRRRGRTKSRRNMIFGLAHARPEQFR